MTNNKLTDERLKTIRAETFAATMRGDSATVEISAALLVDILDQLREFRSDSRKPGLWEITDPDGGAYFVRDEPHDTDWRKALVVQRWYAAPPAAAWYPAETSPDIPRGKFLDCWVAGHFCERDHAAGPGQYKSAQPLVLLARWGGAELLRGDEGGWSVVDMPDGSFTPRAWQPIAKPDFPLGAL
ncbi:hypothetical protein YN18_001224 [Salmonella enterica subsp. enterica]|nr:hypothetical protein [Salmonella enterica subsp. enterica]EDR2888287.1 hypothetical protein [Salmonella enterica subsp. enterica]EDR6140808.1 hypothetical protein [Salmonella enterica subsp. enterica]EDU9860130.1 hypothetical protein [Salmonella enterica subsp. enterica]EDV0530416.1 hypothetical protein [Salmonella enterica subsp. enterica]